MINLNENPNVSENPNDELQNAATSPMGNFFISFFKV